VRAGQKIGQTRPPRVVRPQRDQSRARAPACQLLGQSPHELTSRRRCQSPGLEPSTGACASCRRMCRKYLYVSFSSEISMNSPHRYQLPVRRKMCVRCIPSKGSNGWGRSYTPMNQVSQSETATALISSQSVTRSSDPVPHQQWMGMGNSAGSRPFTTRLLSRSRGYDSCIARMGWSGSNARSPLAGVSPAQLRILASTKSALRTAGIKYPGQWLAIDEARSTRRLSQPPFRHYHKQRRTHAGAPQHY
jgi:hypothetical protein